MESRCWVEGSKEGEQEKGRERGTGPTSPVASSFRCTPGGSGSLAPFVDSGLLLDSASIWSAFLMVDVREASPLRLIGDAFVGRVSPFLLEGGTTLPPGTRGNSWVGLSTCGIKNLEVGRSVCV